MGIDSAKLTQPQMAPDDGGSLSLMPPYALSLVTEIGLHGVLAAAAAPLALRRVSRN